MTGLPPSISPGERKAPVIRHRRIGGCTRWPWPSPVRKRPEMDELLLGSRSFQALQRRPPSCERLRSTCRRSGCGKSATISSPPSGTMFMCNGADAVGHVMHGPACAGIGGDEHGSGVDIAAQRPRSADAAGTPAAVTAAIIDDDRLAHEGAGMS